MALTTLNTAAINSSGSWSFDRVGWRSYVWFTVHYPTDPDLVVYRSHYWRTAASIAASIAHGPCSVSMVGRDTLYGWNTTTKEWTLGYGPSLTEHGYPAALDPPGVDECWQVIVRTVLATCTAGLVTEQGIISTQVMHAMSLGQEADGGTSVTDLEVAWSVDIERMTKDRSRGAALLEGGEAHAVHASRMQLRDRWRNDEWTVSATCGSISATSTMALSADPFPAFAASLTTGAAVEWVEQEFTAPSNGWVVLPYTCMKRLATEDRASWFLPEQYPGLRATGREVIASDTVGGSPVDACVYTFASSYAQFAWTAKTDTWPTPTGGAASVGPFTRSEWIQCWTRLGYDLRVFDEQTVIEGLEATAAYIVDQTMEWDEDEQAYVRAATFGQQIAFEVPARVSVSFAPTSRYADIALADGTASMWARLTDASLEALELPTADNRFEFDCGPLDWETGAWDAAGHDGMSNGARQGLLRFARHEVDVQFPQDIVNDGTPPSWWTTEANGVAMPLEREFARHAVLPTADGPPLTIRRDFHHLQHERGDKALLIQRGPDTYAPADGYAQGLLPKWWYNFKSSLARKHGRGRLGSSSRPGHGWGATVPCLGGVVNWAEGAPVLVELKRSEDAVSWVNFPAIALLISCSGLPDWRGTVRVHYRYVSSHTDNHESDITDRLAGWSMKWTSAIAEWPITVRGDQADQEIVLDFFRARAPRLECVDAIEIAGIPGLDGGEFRLKAMPLIPWDPHTRTRVGDLRMRVVYPRCLRNGGQKRYTCGAEPAFLGWARQPEEATSLNLFTESAAGLDARDDELADVGVSPEGLESWTRVVTECGRDQSHAITLAGLAARLYGDWGEEGLYGVWSPPLAWPWVDALGAALGELYAFDVCERLWLEVADADGLGESREIDGATDPHVAIRCGGARVCQGANWVLEDGEAFVVPGRKFLRSARAEYAYDKLGETAWLRVGPGIALQLWQQRTRDGEETTERLVDEGVTDNWGRWVPTAGANEQRHTEPGARNAEGDPELPLDQDSDRADFRSDVVAPGQARDYVQAHYQELLAYCGSRQRVGGTTQRIDARRAPWGADVLVRSMPLRWSDEGAAPAHSGLVLDHYASHAGRGGAPEYAIPLGIDRACPALLVRASGDVVIAADTGDHSIALATLVATGGATGAMPSVDGYSYPALLRHPHTGGDLLMARNVETLEAEFLVLTDGAWVTRAVLGASDAVSGAIVGDPNGVLRAYVVRDGAIHIHQSTDDGRTWSEV